MRTLGLCFSVLVAVATVVGCGDDDRSGIDSGPVMIDSGPRIDTGPRPDTGPLPDTGPRDSGGTGMCPAGMCDLLTGSGCMAGQACYFLAMAAGSPAMPVCDTAGTGGDGAACTDYRDCQEGFFCDSGAMICRHYCCMGSDTGCPTGQECAVSIVDDMGMDTGVGICSLSDTCDPAAQTGCPDGQGCYTRGADGSVICIGSLMNLGEGEACGMATNNCAPGFACFGVGGEPAVCHKYCNATEMTGCADGQTCGSLGYPAPVDHVGLCTPVATP
jgi:hypothetical protein